MKLVNLAVAALALTLVGCPTLNPQSGMVKCSADSAHLCPDGYVCVNSLCYKNGQQPQRDMSVNGSMDMDMSIGPDMTIVTPTKPNGVSCMVGGECVSMNCVDGVCCDTACGDSCHACNVTGAVGTCSVVPAGVAPMNAHPACGPDAMSTCMRDGACDGKGNCRLWNATTTCKASSCDSTANTQTGASLCDGSGHCVTPLPISCGPYVCKPDNSQCWPSCSDNTACKSPNTCALPAGSCGLKPNGLSCGGGTECMSGNCVDDTCCDKTQAQCNGCMACNVGTSPGTCSPVPNGSDTHGVCPYPCSGGCNGAGACSSGTSNTVCSFACQDTCDWTNKNAIEGQCFGQNAKTGTCTNNPGMCGTPTATYCPGSLTCASATACKTSCNSDADCQYGFYCSGPGGSCNAKLPIGNLCSRTDQCDPVQGQNGYALCNGSCVNCNVTTDCIPSNPICDTTAAGHSCNLCKVNSDCSTPGFGSSCGSTTTYVCNCASSGECTNPRVGICAASPSSSQGMMCTCNTTAAKWGACPAGYSCISAGPNGVCKLNSGRACTSGTDCYTGNCQSNGTCF